MVDLPAGHRVRDRGQHRAGVPLRGPRAGARLLGHAPQELLAAEGLRPRALPVQHVVQGSGQLGRQVVGLLGVIRVASTPSTAVLICSASSWLRYSPRSRT